MEALPDLFAQYGLIAVFMVVLAEQLGAPIPALPVLLMAGAFASDNPFYGVAALVLAIAAATLGDTAWYWAGRRYGHRVLRLLCRISLSPDACVRQTENAYERRGVATLVIAKFIPGLSTLAPPLAGALRVSTANFLLFNTAGAALWAGTGLIVGLVFHRNVDAVLAWLLQMGIVAVMLVVALLAIYIGWRWWERRRLLKLLATRRITPMELSEWLERGDELVILDVRSRLLRDVEQERIPGARALDLDNMEVALAELTTDHNIVVYCACPNDASAVKATLALMQRGYKQVRPLAGGIDAWRSAGLALEMAD